MPVAETPFRRRKAGSRSRGTRKAAKGPQNHIARCFWQRLDRIASAVTLACYRSSIGSAGRSRRHQSTISARQIGSGGRACRVPLDYRLVPVTTMSIYPATAPGTDEHRAVPERWFQRQRRASGRARLGAGIPCTRRSAAHGLRLRCRASSADPAALSCAAQRPARRLCLAVARGGAYCFGGGGNASRQAKTGSCTPNCCWMTGAVRPTFQPMQDDGGARA